MVVIYDLTQDGFSLTAEESPFHPGFDPGLPLQNNQ